MKYLYDGCAGLQSLLPSAHSPMAKRHRRRGSHQQPPSPSQASGSGSSHPESLTTCDEQPPSVADSPAEPCEPITPPTAESSWFRGDMRPWANLARPSALSSTDLPISVNLAPRPELACCPTPLSPISQSRAPSPAASVESLSTCGSGDSGALLRSRSKLSNVTSISIPPSIAQLPPSELPIEFFCPPPVHCVAPIPTRRLSSLESFCLKPKTTRHSQFYFTDDLVILSVGCPSIFLGSVSQHCLNRWTDVCLEYIEASLNESHLISGGSLRRRLAVGARMRLQSSCHRCPSRHLRFY